MLWSWLASRCDLIFRCQRTSLRNGRHVMVLAVMLVWPHFSVSKVRAYVMEVMLWSWLPCRCDLIYRCQMTSLRNGSHVMVLAALSVWPHFSVWKNEPSAIAQAVSRPLPTATAQVRARVWSCGICGGQSGAGSGFLRVLRFLLPIFTPPIAPQSPSSIIWGLYNRPELAAVPVDLGPPH
jgi:hypothetical protein